MTEIKSLRELTADGLRLSEEPFKPAEQLGLLHTLFSHLKTLLNEPGNYLIR